jgi:serine phosphatase RsbU (regulator of sigma subunit)/putative methionine-R-sulfoxide reductase with GAF domain
VQNQVAKSLTESINRASILHPVLTTLYTLAVGLLGLGILGYRISTDPQDLAWLPILVFAALSLLIQRSSFHFGTPIVHSLAGVIDVSAVLALGPASGAAVAALGGFTYLELNAIRHQKLTHRHLFEIPLFNAGLKASMALLGGALFEMLVGPLPLSGSYQRPAQDVDLQIILAVCAVSLLWFVLDHIAWGILDYLEGGLDRVRAFVRAAMPQAVFIELLPLPSGLVVALVYTQLGWTAFALVAVAIVAISVLTQHWADARNELIQRVAELSTIEQVGRAIAEAQLDVDELCHLMYEHASQVADTTIFQLGLFNGDEYAVRLWIREGQQEPQRTFRLSPGVGLVNWLRETKQPILVHDFLRELDSLPAKPAYVSERPPRSALFVPLIAGETVIGTMSIQSFRRSAYGSADLRVLSAMANQAAVAIQKAQLYAQERKRARQLEIIGQISRQVTATMELDDLFNRTVRLIRESFGYYHVAIFTADREQETVTFEASASAGDQNVALEVAWNQGLIGWVAAQAEAVMVNDVEADTRYRCIEALDEARSELAVPLLLEDELVGVLDVQSDQVDAFGPDDLFILETMGDQIAIAIQEARLYEAERQQAWFSTALLQVAEARSQVEDMDAVLTTIVRLTPILVGVDRCAVLLWDPELETFIPGETYGLTSELRELFSHMRFRPEDVPALDLVRWDKSPLHISTPRDGLLFPREMVETFDIHEMVILPLLAQGELLGTMLVDYAGRTHPFTDRMIDMLTGIANQAAMVIHAARLVQAQQEEAYVSMALLQVAEVVNRSTDLEETMGAIARITPMLVGVEACAILLRDQTTGDFVPFQQYGLPREAQDAFWQLRWTQDAFPLRQLVGDPPFLILQDRGDDEQATSLWGQDSVLALPLSTKSGIQGIMSVSYDDPAKQVAQRWLNTLQGIAGQAAIAVENDRLLREAAEQERMKQELDVARRIQASFLPDCCPVVPGWELAVIWRSAREVGGDFYDFIPLPPLAGKEDRTGVVIADVADKGVPAALYMALSRTLVRTMAIDGRPPSVAVARANDLILSDARSDLFVTLFYAILEPDSGTVAFVNAGHMPALLVRVADGSVEELLTHGMALGVVADLEFEEARAHLVPGDMIILYTDGVVEALDASQQMFGKERLIEVLRTHRAQSAGQLAETINDTIASFVGDVPQFDDFTLVVVKRQR